MGLSLPDAAKLVGLTVGHWRALERGDRKFQPATLRLWEAEIIKRIRAGHKISAAGSVRIQRQVLGYTQDEAAELIGMPQAQWSRYERGVDPWPKHHRLAWHRLWVRMNALRFAPNDPRGTLPDVIELTESDLKAPPLPNPRKPKKSLPQPKGKRRIRRRTDWHRRPQGVNWC